MISDEQLQQIQSTVFHTTLPDNELNNIRNHIHQQGNPNDNQSGISLSEFTLLFNMIAKEGRIQVCWDTLNHFGYMADGTKLILQPKAKQRQNSISQFIADLNYALKQPITIIFFVIVAVLSSSLIGPYLSRRK